MQRMKRIGLLGGMSWESTASYYREINEEVKRRLGGLHSAPLLINSVDFQRYEQLQHQEAWDEIARRLATEARRLETAGADLLLLCTNTMHKVADTIESALTIPLLHIADATGQAIGAENIVRVGLLGTAFTMEEPFYRDRLMERYGLEVLVPEAAERMEVHRIIYEELCLGRIEADSKHTYLKIMERLGRQGAQGIILGCTEIALLVGQEDTGLSLFDTTRIHAQAGVDLALNL